MTVLRMSRLVQEVYSGFKRQILMLDREPGSFVYEGDLAAEFDVSRTPVRQAISALEHEGLVQVHSQRGIQITELSIAKILEAQQVREALEIYAIERVAKIWDSADPVMLDSERSIQHNLQSQTEALQTKDYLEFSKLDREFHELMIEPLGNKYLSRTLGVAHDHLARLRIVELIEMEHGLASVVDHQEIFDAVKTNRPDGARGIMITHLSMLDLVRDRIFANHPNLFIQ